MIKVSTKKPSMSAGKKTIKITNCTISNGSLIDDEGEIIERIKENVGSDEFTIIISLPLEGSEE